MKTINNTTTNNAISAFAEEVAAALRDKLVDAEITVREVPKNNGIILHGISITFGEQCYPTVYLEYFYDRYDGEISDELLEEVRKTCESRSAGNINMDFIQDYSQIKSDVYMRLINKQANADFLADSPYVEYGDLAAIFAVKIRNIPIVNEAGSEASFVIRNSHLNMWGGITAADLWAQAWENIRGTFSITPMWKVLSKLNPMMFCGDVLEELKESSSMAILNSETMSYGAVGILDTELLASYAEELEDELWVIPSSIHEAIVVPMMGNGMSEEAITDMIRAVNGDELDPMEVLSDHVYVYSREDGKLHGSLNGPAITPVVMS